MTKQDFQFQVGQLRHLYMHMARRLEALQQDFTDPGYSDVTYEELARAQVAVKHDMGLLGPVIETLERFTDAVAVPVKKCNTSMAVRPDGSFEPCGKAILPNGHLCESCQAHIDGVAAPLRPQPTSDTSKE